MTKSIPQFYSGTSNLVLPVTKAAFPPAFRDSSRLGYYSSLFNSLEVNSSFYKTPKAATVAKWAEQVPGNFKFSFKLSKALTHTKGFDFNEDDVAPFMQAIAAAGTKKGCLLIQLPPSVTIDKLDRLQKLLSLIAWENDDQWKLAVEFRHSSWYEKEAYEILREYHAAIVLHDMPASAPPLFATGEDFVFVRFHGPGGNYRGTYTDEHLSTFAHHIKSWMKRGKTVYFYFNNTIGDAYQNLQTLNSFLLKT